MTRWAGWAIVLLGGWTAFTGGWGLIEGTGAETDDLLWIGSSLVTAGIAIVLIGLARLGTLRI